MMSRTALLTAVALFGWAHPLAAQEGPEILVELSDHRVYEGKSVLYQVTLNHVENPSPPELSGLEDFRVESLGEQSLDSTRVTIINGQMTKVVRRGRAYRYRLTPRKTGILRIPPPVAKVDGQVLKGPEQFLEVIPAEQQDTVFLEITSDRQAVYPMQPFTVTLRVAVKPLPPPYAERSPVAVQWELRQRQPLLRIPWIGDELPEGLESKEDLNQWARPLLTSQRGGFRINDLGARSSSFFSLFDEPEPVRFLPKARQVVRQNKDARPAEYWEYELQRTFHPRRIGQFTFGPVTLEGVFVVDVAEGGKADVEQIYAVAKAIEVTSRDVPREGRPDTYIGAVGQFSLAAELEPKRAKVGDPMTLTLTLGGQGTLENAFAPDLAGMPEIAEKFKIYEATEEVQRSSCRFTYGLRPLEEGIEAFPAVPVSYFDVESERYVTLRSDPVPIEVTKAERLSDDQIVATPGGPSGRPRELQVRREGIFANVTDPAAVRDQSIHPGRWLLGLIGMAGLYAVVAVVTVRIQRLSADTALLCRRGAIGRARTRLQQAAAELESGRAREGADLVQDALVGLIADVADLPEAGLTPKDVCGQLQALGVEGELVGRAGSLLEACDATRYGAVNQAGGLGPRAQGVLEELIQSLKAKKRFR